MSCTSFENLEDGKFRVCLNNTPKLFALVLSLTASCSTRQSSSFSESFSASLAAEDTEVWSNGSLLLLFAPAYNELHCCCDLSVTAFATWLNVPPYNEPLLEVGLEFLPFVATVGRVSYSIQLSSASNAKQNNQCSARLLRPRKNIAEQNQSDWHHRSKIQKTATYIMYSHAHYQRIIDDNWMLLKHQHNKCTFPLKTLFLLLTVRIHFWLINFCWS